MNGSRGQSTAELAVVLPLICILLFAVVQIGLVARDRVAVQHAARGAARQAAVTPGEAEALAGATSAAPGLDPGRFTVRLTGGRATGDLLTVQVAYRSATTVPLVGLFVDDVELTEVAVVRVE
jgi:Flp pilus assembly protein TadG